MTTDDLDTLTDWWLLDDWAVLQQYTIKPRTRTAVGELFTAWSANDSTSGAGFSIDDENGDLIGHLAMFGIELPARIATFAIMLGPDYAGHGYGPDATKVALRYAFEELGCHKVELQAWAFNTRAVRAYEKAGFVSEGIRRAAAFHAGKFHDQVRMGILEEEFRENSAS